MARQLLRESAPGRLAENNQQATGLAQAEIMAGRLISFSHRFIGDEDETSASIFSFGADSLFWLRDEWRNEDASIGCRVKPHVAGFA